MFYKFFKSVVTPSVISTYTLPASVAGKYLPGSRCAFFHSGSVRNSHLSSSQDVIEDNTEAENVASQVIFDKVNEHIAGGPGRLFAVIQIAGKQYRVVENDVLLIERNWAPEQNERLTFEKVLLVGGSSFTLIGKPILPRNVVKVIGTIVHKDLTHTKLRYYTIPKERVHHLNFVREELTYIRINKIRVYPEINDMSKAEYLRGQ